MQGFEFKTSLMVTIVLKQGGVGKILAGIPPECHDFTKKNFPTHCPSIKDC